MCTIKDNVIKTNNKKVFLSYCSDDKPIADLIKEKLTKQTHGMIDISEYTEVKYKESFIKFMNSIQQHQFALCIVSDGYLKSPNCMYEVGEFISCSGFEDKLLFVVLSDSERHFYCTENRTDKYQLKVANVYSGFGSKMKYMMYWQEVYKKQKKAIRKINNYKARKILKTDLQKTKRIYTKDIGTFINFLADYNGKTFQELYDNNFKDLLSYISPNNYYSVFKEYNSYSKLFRSAISKIREITKTDYNQIALCLKIDRHKLGLVVVADDISNGKQKYRLVDYNGFMGMTYADGELRNIANINVEKEYLDAVGETKSEIVVPIKILNRVVGVINSESETASYYNSEMVSQLTELSWAFAICVKALGYSPNIPYEDVPYIDNRKKT